MRDIVCQCVIRICHEGKIEHHSLPLTWRIPATAWTTLKELKLYGLSDISHV
jgi:hypothetical protein